MVPKAPRAYLQSHLLYRIATSSVICYHPLVSSSYILRHAHAYRNSEPPHTDTLACRTAITPYSMVRGHETSLKFSGPRKLCTITRNPPPDCKPSVSNYPYCHSRCPHLAYTNCNSGAGSYFRYHFSALRIRCAPPCSSHRIKSLYWVPSLSQSNRSTD